MARDSVREVYGDDPTPEELAQAKKEQEANSYPCIVEFADGRIERYDSQYKAMSMARGEDAPDYYEHEYPDPLILDQEERTVGLVDGKVYQALRNGAILRIYGTKRYWLHGYDKTRPDAIVKRA